MRRGALWVVSAGCHEQQLARVVDPNQPIGQLDCTCRFHVESDFDVFCTVSRCQCDAWSTGPCAAPRDEVACRQQIANAIDNCGLLGAAIPPPDPTKLELDVIDAFCSRFAHDSCELVFQGSFCTGPDVVPGQEDSVCWGACTPLAHFLDNKFYFQSAQYECGSVEVSYARGVAGRKEECGLECPEILCDPTNLETCTQVHNRLRGCSGGYTSDRLCRAPDSDPPMLAAGGLLANTVTRRSTVEVDSAQSFISLAGATGTLALAVTGRVDVLGETCAGCATSVHLSVAAASLSFEDHALTEIALSAGTGSTPIIPFDPSGLGVIRAGLMSGTLSMRIDGVASFLTAQNLGQIQVRVDRAHARFSLDGELATQRDGVSASGHLHIQGPITNQPPTANVGDPTLSLECTSPTGTPVRLGASVDDPDGPGDLLFVGWQQLVNGAPGDELNGAFAAEVAAPQGSSRWEFSATDRSLQSHRAVKEVTVTDTTPPAISAARALCLWPPNHKYVVLRTGRDVATEVTDACDTAPSVHIVGARASQADDATADGNTTNDVVAFDDHVCLRAERAGNDEAREYVIELQAIDSSGNSTTATQHVIVPHDQRDRGCIKAERLEQVEDDDPLCMPPAPPSPTPPSTGGCASTSGSVFVALALMIMRRRWRP